MKKAKEQLHSRDITIKLAIFTLDYVTNFFNARKEHVYLILTKHFWFKRAIRVRKSGYDFFFLLPNVKSVLWAV